MSDFLSADEVVAIGIRVEKNGQAFYRAAAMAADQPLVKGLFNELAEMEGDHEGLFENLRKDLKAKTAGKLEDRDKDLSETLKSAADNHIFAKGLDGAAAAKKCKTARDLLEMALQFEKDSVIYFAALHDMVPEGPGKEDIGVLVTEELKHVTMLNKKIKEIW
jgi:rubrerythrin